MDRFDVETNGQEVDPPADQSASLVSSEEQARVRVIAQPYARMRLVKYVVTDYVTQTVAVRREEVRLESMSHEPETSHRGTDGPHEVEPFGQDDIELVLHRERVVVSTEVVPTERVRLHFTEVTTPLSVTADLQREIIEVVTAPRVLDA